jgi:hypothetical protein
MPANVLLPMNRSVVARASRPCEHSDRHTGETPVPLVFFSFMVPMHARKRKAALHEPHFPNPNDE